jgi:hypothetical protein
MSNKFTPVTITNDDGTEEVINIDDDLFADLNTPVPDKPRPNTKFR